MRLAFLICSIVLAFTIPSKGRADDTDPYSISTVKFELQIRSGGRKVIHTQTQRVLVQLGDGVSVALLKILGQEELTESSTVRTYLPIIRDSFAKPDEIANDMDKRPGVTLFLLNYLQERVNDAQLQQEIKATIEFVISKTR